MAVGDTVIQVSALATALEFQPAVGVSVLITAWSTGSTNGWVKYIDSSATTTTYLWQTTAGSDERAKFKLFINNTTWINIAAASAGEKSSFSGIQIQ